MRRLCDRCLQSVPADSLRPDGGVRICPDCAARAAAAANGERNQPAPEPAGTRRGPRAWAHATLAEAGAWCAGRCWWVRAPLILWLAVVLVRHLSDAEYQSLFKPLNLGIHELGHFVFRPFGMFLSIAGGSLLQLLVPAGSLIMFYRQPDFFGIAVALGWLGTNWFDVAVYVGDARSQALPLVSVGGGEVIHDWHYLLQRCGLLNWDHTLQALCSAAGAGTLALAIAFGTWLLWRMARTPASGF